MTYYYDKCKYVFLVFQHFSNVTITPVMVTYCIKKYNVKM